METLPRQHREFTRFSKPWVYSHFWGSWFISHVDLHVDLHTLVMFPGFDLHGFDPHWATNHTNPETLVSPMMVFSPIDAIVVGCLRSRKHQRSWGSHCWRCFSHSIPLDAEKMELHSRQLCRVFLRGWYPRTIKNHLQGWYPILLFNGKSRILKWRYCTI